MAQSPLCLPTSSPEEHREIFWFLLEEFGDLFIDVARQRSPRSLVYAPLPGSSFHLDKPLVFVPKKHNPTPTLPPGDYTVYMIREKIDGEYTIYLNCLDDKVERAAAAFRSFCFAKRHVLGVMQTDWRAVTSIETLDRNPRAEAPLFSLLTDLEIEEGIRMLVV